jgi:hypothetical protein
MSPITTQDYLGVFLISPILVCIIGVLILPFSSRVAGTVVKIGVGLLFFVILYFLFFYFFGKKITYKSKRREKWFSEEAKAIPHSSSYYFDLIELAKTKGWNIVANGKRELRLNGMIGGQSFEVCAVYESVAGDIKQIVDTISVALPINIGPKISITEGRLYGLLGEHVIKNTGLEEVAVTGEDNKASRDFLIKSKNEIEALVASERNNVRVMTFEAGKLSVDLNSDSDENGDTFLDIILSSLAKIAGYYNSALHQNKNV